MKFIPMIFTGMLSLILYGCGKNQSPFTITESDSAIVVLEKNDPVFSYRKKTKPVAGNYIFCNYIHPLYDLNGNILTDEFPADHPYHRGIFWAWHQLYEGSTRLGDGWTNDSIWQEVKETGIIRAPGSVRLQLKVNWYSSVHAHGRHFMEEQTAITVYSRGKDIRKLDIMISLQSAVEDLRLGGSADQKGYGGLCARLRTPDSLIFTSDGGRVMPQELQIKAGPWMDISGPFGQGGEISGITILCHPSMPDYPEPWILRQKGSMQNIVWPGSDTVPVPMDKPLILKYRLIIHNGDAGSINLQDLQDEYAKMAN